MMAFSMNTYSTSSVIYRFIIVVSAIILLGRQSHTYAQTISKPETYRLLFLNGTQESDWQKILDDAYQHRASSSEIAAYHAASEIMMARYAFTPWGKYNFFKTGSQRIDSIISFSPTVDGHFLRLLIQLNIPSFLSYNTNISSDWLYIYNNLIESTIPITTQKLMIEALSKSKINRFSANQLNQLKSIKQSLANHNQENPLNAKTKHK